MKEPCRKLSLEQPQKELTSGHFWNAAAVKDSREHPRTHLGGRRTERLYAKGNAACTRAPRALRTREHFCTYSSYGPALVRQIIAGALFTFSFFEIILFSSALVASFKKLTLSNL